MDYIPLYYLYTVEPCYNKDLGTLNIALLCQVSCYIRVNRNIKSWVQQIYLVKRGFCNIQPLYNKVPLNIQRGFCDVITQNL